MGLSRKKYLTIPDCLAHANRKLDKNIGYVRVYVGKDYPGANTRGYAYEHRVVMEIKLGRYLSKDEHVHHINHCRWDNRPENLMVVSNKDHGKITQSEIAVGYEMSTVENTDFSEEIMEYLNTHGVLRYKRTKKPQKPKQLIEYIEHVDGKPKRLSAFQKYKSNKPSKEILEELVAQYPVAHISKLFNVTDNSVKKWCKSYNIPNRPRGYWTKLKYNKII
jgi:hypothetical protein